MSAQQSAVRIDTLPSFPFLSFLEDSRRPTWALKGPNAATTTVSFDPVLRSGDFNILLRAAAAGLGIALLPAEVAEDDILCKAAGPDSSRLAIWKKSPSISCSPRTVEFVPAVRVLIDYLAEHFKFRQEQRPPRKSKPAKFVRAI